MRKVKYFILVFFLIIVGLFVYSKLTKPETIMMVGTEVSLEKPWVKFDDGDDSKIGNLIRAYNFEEGESRFKKNIGENEFIIASLRKDKKWNYYYYYRGQETYEMMLISEEMENEISSPY